MKTSKCCNAKIHEQNGLTYCSHCISIISKNQIKADSRLAYAAFFIFFTLFMFVSANTSHSSVGFKYIACKIESEIIPDVQLNDSDIIEELVKQKCEQIPWALAQFHIETREIDKQGKPVPYTSSVCLNCKNLGGIRFRVKGSKAIGQTKDEFHYLIYASYKDCIYDYVTIQKGYLKAIDGHYAANKDYVSLLKKIK